MVVVKMRQTPMVVSAGTGGGGDMNYEQQALKMEQDDLAKLKMGKNPYAEQLENLDSR